MPPEYSDIPNTWNETPKLTENFLETEKIRGEIVDKDKLWELNNILWDATLNIGQQFEKSFSGLAERNLFVKRIKESEKWQIKYLVVKQVLKHLPDEQRQEIIDRIKKVWPNDDKMESTIAEIIPWWYRAFDENINVVSNKTEDSERKEEEQKKEEEGQKKEEEKKKKEEEKKKKEEEEQKKEEERQKWKEKEEKERSSKLEEIREKRKELLQNHPKIAEEIEKKAAEIKNNIQVPPEIKKQLKKSGYNEDFINEYILSKVTLSEVKKNPVFEPNKVKEFEWLVWELDDWLRLNSLDVFLKNIDNACNVADTRLSSFSSNENLSQTRHELFYDSVWNEDLIALKSSNIEMRNENSDGKGDYEKMFPEMSEEDMVKTYWKFLSKSKWAQHYLDEYNERDRKSVV